MPFPEKISKRNKRGILVLISLIALIVMFPRIYGWYLGSEPIIVSVEELDRGVSELESKKQFSSARNKQKKKKYHSPASRFNPNEYTQTDWMYLGLSEKQAAVVLKFTKRGIYNNDQLKQIFVIDEALFALIKDSTFYSERKNRKDENKRDTYEPKQKININTATAEELQKLYGIGKYFSEKIVEYREKLGGYISQKQLLEIYNFDQEKLENIKNRIMVEVDDVKQININSCLPDELAKHPYIRWNVANSIVKMRAKHQEYTDINQLLESELIDKLLLEKIKPYLTLD